ncbi:MAG TPA: hypothetical protein V6D29_22115 [Leptolyngbyaceae cyanobacterium]
MFQSSESGADASKIPPAQPAKGKPQPDRIRVALYGSLASIERTVKILHALTYADPNDWSEPVPTGRPHEWVSVVVKHLLIE